MDWQRHQKKNSNQDPLRGMEDFMGRLMGDPSFLVKVLLAVAVVAAAYSCWFTVKPQEQAVVTRFGRYVETAKSGLHFKLPFGIDRVAYVQTEELRQEAFGFYLREGNNQQRVNPFAQNPFSRSYTSSQRNTNEESLMLTGDLNVADVNWVVQYKVNRAKDYLFNVSDPTKTIRDISQAVMRRVVGDTSINNVITVGKAGIERRATELTQEILEDYGLGVEIRSVVLQDVTPPESVIPSFNEVNAALQEQKQAINKAEAEQNRVIPEARGKAEQTILEAEGYATALVNQAEGDANKFEQIVKEYQLAPEVTKTRLYLELVEKILTRVDALTFVDANLKGLLPLYGSSGKSDEVRAGLSMERMESQQKEQHNSSADRR